MEASCGAGLASCTNPEFPVCLFNPVCGYACVDALAVHVPHVIPVRDVVEHEFVIAGILHVVVYQVRAAERLHCGPASGDVGVKRTILESIGVVREIREGHVDGTSDRRDVDCRGCGG